MHHRETPFGAEARCGEPEPTHELYVIMGVMHATFEQLVVALKRLDREAVHAASRGFVTAWSRAYLLLSELPTPNGEARAAVRSARRALREAGGVDLLFGDALVSAPRAVCQFINDARADVAGALEREPEDVREQDLQ